MSLAITSTTDEAYVVLENLVRDRVSAHEDPLFETSATPDALWSAYLQNLPAERRGHYACHSCRRFVQRFGGLVKIDADGTIRSLLWQGDEEVPPFFAASVRTLVDLIAGSKVTGVFLSADRVLGVSRTPDKKRGVTWSHLSVEQHESRIYKGRVLTADQVVAEKLEDFKMLGHAMSDYPLPLVTEALRVLRADALARSEKALGVAEWFERLHRESESGRNRNVVWRAVATAPPGFAHVRSTVISTLLDDVKAGLPFAEISRRWGEKMNPLQYQRPQAAPKDGAIEAAEKLVLKLGIAPSFERRFATLDDVLAKVWSPAPQPEKKATKTGGVFDHLRGASEEIQKVELPATKITWEKLARTILPSARSVEVQVPSHGNFCGVLTAVHADAPPILQWDGLEGHPRNPASMYVYASGSPASGWGLGPGWARATAIFLGPHAWQAPEKFGHISKGVQFAIEGARDLLDAGCGTCLFPEILKSEFHGIRSVIEAHSQRASIPSLTEAEARKSASGLRFDGSIGAVGVTIRVDGSATYVIDRWD